MGAPPSRGSTIRATSGWTRKSRKLPTRIVSTNSQRRGEAAVTGGRSSGVQQPRRVERVIGQDARGARAAEGAQGFEDERVALPRPGGPNGRAPGRERVCQDG